MAIEAGNVVSELILDGQKYFSTLAQADKQTKTFAEKMSNAGKKVESVGKKMFLGVTVPILGAGAAAFKLASDMEEAINKVDVAFKDNSKEVKAWSANTLKNFGIAKGSALDMAALFGDMATSMGLPTKEAANMSTSLVGLAGDLASFKNIGLDQAASALNGIFTGETESLKTLGIVMTQTNLESFALANGFKKTYKAMSEAEKVNLRYAYVMDKTKNAQGDFARTNTGAANQMRIFKESLKELGATFGANLLPVITPVIQKVNDLIQKFGSLDKGTQQTIIKVAAFAALAGPVLIGTGKMITGVSAIVGLFSKLSLGAGAASTALGATATAGATAGAGATVGAGGLGLLAGGLGSAALAAAPFVLAGAAVVGTGYLIHKKLNEEVVPAVDLFADKVEVTSSKVSGSYAYMAGDVQTQTTKITKATQDAVGAYIAMDDGVTAELTNLYLNSTILTDTNTASMVEKYNTMGQTILAGMQTQHNERYTEMQTFFANSSALTDAEEVAALEKMNLSNEEKKKSIEEYTQQIQSILTTAKENNRALTSKEQIQINAIQDNMRVNAVNSLSATEVESKVILERLKEYGTRITTEQAANIIKNANDTRDKAVKAANSQYTETVSNIIRMRDESGSITAAQADKMIADAKKSKEETIKKAEEMRSGVVGKLEQMSPEVASKVDTQTGKIKTGWSNLKSWWDGLSFGNKEATITTKHVTVNEIINRTRVGGNGKVGSNAKGTSNWRGGFTEINERGYEVLDLPGGTRIYPHEASKDIVKAMGKGGTTINFNGSYSFNDKEDINYFMNQSALLINRRNA